jgi:hypothetical protein
MATSYRCLLVCGLAMAGWAQSPQPKVSIEPRARPGTDLPVERRGNIRVDTTLVLINATVIDPMSRFVTGLEKEHFRLFEEKVEQKFTPARTRL